MTFFRQAKTAIMELQGKPKLYRDVRNLLDQVNTESKKKEYSKEIHYALVQFEARLADALRAYDQNPESNESFQTLAETSHSAIYAYQPTLMSAPGLWNQLKAFINNFFEEYFNVEPLFNTDNSSLALNDNFRNRFSDVKMEIKTLIANAEPEENSCCLGF